MLFVFMPDEVSRRWAHEGYGVNGELGGAIIGFLIGFVVLGGLIQLIFLNN